MIYKIFRILHKDFKEVRRRVKFAVDNSRKKVTLDEALRQVKEHREPPNKNLYATLK